MADGGTFPHVMHRPNNRFAGGDDLLNIVQGQHALIDPMQVNDICLFETGSRVTSNPVLAMDTLKRFFRLKRLFAQIMRRSQINVNFLCQDLPTVCTLSEWLVLCSTNIPVSIPAPLSDSIRRFAAIAAPPIRSEVLMISTLMRIKVYANVRFSLQIYGCLR